MIRIRVSIVGLIALAGIGCATTDRQVSDLRTPAPPRLTWQATQKLEPVAKAPQPKDLVIREHRFVSHSAQLNSDGEDQVQRLANCLRASPAKIFIEPSDGIAAQPVTKASATIPDTSAKLDLQRRQFVVQKLLTLGIPDAESRVVIQPAT